MIRILSFALAVVSATVLVLGIAVRLSEKGTLFGMAPVTMWRFSVACIGFAIYLHLFARDDRSDS
jgi:hypothetical protein